MSPTKFAYFSVKAGRRKHGIFALRNTNEFFAIFWFK